MSDSFLVGDADLVHAALGCCGGSGGVGCGIGLVNHQGLGGQHAGGNGSGVDQGGTGDLGGIDDTGSIMSTNSSV